MRIFLIFLLTLGVLVLSGCESEYVDHFSAEHQKVVAEVEIPEVSNEEVLILPDISVKKRLIEEIQKATDRIWIEIYLWTDKDILQEVLNAKSRGVDVRAVLEGNVYDMPYANATLYRTLSGAHVPVVYADNYRYTFTHAKFWIIDKTYFISTGNLTKSFFTSNRDLIVVGNSISVLEFLEELFLKDALHESFGPTIPKNIIISPTTSRMNLLSLIDSAQESIDVFVQTVTDEEILDHLFARQEDGVRVRICTALNESTTSVSSGSSFLWKQVKKPYLHAKMLYIDKNTFWIGSQNFTSNSLDNNREVGIILSLSGTISEKLSQIIKKDCGFE